MVGFNLLKYNVLTRCTGEGRLKGVLQANSFDLKV